MEITAKKIKEQKGTLTVDEALRGGKVAAPKMNPKDAAAIASVKNIYEQIGALAVSIDTAKSAKKKLQAKLAASEDGKKLAGVNDKMKRDKKQLTDLLGMYKGQILLCKQQNTQLPAEMFNAKLLNK